MCFHVFTCLSIVFNCFPLFFKWFPKVFQWVSIVFQRMAIVFSMVGHCFPMVCHCFSMAFHDFPMVFHYLAKVFPEHGRDPAFRPSSGTPRYQGSRRLRRGYFVKGGKDSVYASALRSKVWNQFPRVKGGRRCKRGARRPVSQVPPGVLGKGGTSVVRPPPPPWNLMNQFRLFGGSMSGDAEDDAEAL